MVFPGLVIFVCVVAWIHHPALQFVSLICKVGVCVNPWENNRPRHDAFP